MNIYHISITFSGFYGGIFIICINCHELFKNFLTLLYAHAVTMATDHKWSLWIASTCWNIEGVGKIVLALLLLVTTPSSQQAQWMPSYANTYRMYGTGK